MLKLRIREVEGLAKASWWVKACLPEFRAPPAAFSTSNPPCERPLRAQATQFTAHLPVKAVNSWRAGRESPLSQTLGPSACPFGGCGNEVLGLRSYRYLSEPSLHPSISLIPLLALSLAHAAHLVGWSVSREEGPEGQRPLISIGLAETQLTVLFR